MSADLLRRAAATLRGPVFVDHNARQAIAELLETLADLDADFSDRDHVLAGAEQALAVARAVLREDDGSTS